MVKIRIPEAHWGRVWRALVANGPVSRLSSEPEYVVSEEQVALLREKKLPFKIVAHSNGQRAENGHA